MATPTAAEHRDLEQRLRDLERAVSDSNSATLRRQPLRGVVAQYDLNSTNLTTGYTEIVSARQDIPVPAGYTRASVLMFVSAGSTFTGTGNGNVAVYPIVQGVGGSPIANGLPGAGACSAVSFLARNLTGLASGSTISLQVQAAANSSASLPVTPGSGNVHLSATVTFYR